MIEYRIFTGSNVPKYEFFKKIKCQSLLKMNNNKIIKIIKIRIQFKRRYLLLIKENSSEFVS